MKTEPADRLVIDELTARFFQIFTNKNGIRPTVELIHELFISKGLIIKNLNGNSEIYSLKQFIDPRLAILTNGTLTEFSEWETSASTDLFGHIAQRFSRYSKSGFLNGEWFEKDGAKSFQFIKTAAGDWKICSLVWDDEP